MLTDEDRAAIDGFRRDLHSFGGATLNTLARHFLRVGIERGDKQGQERMREHNAHLCEVAAASAIDQIIRNVLTEMASAIRALKVE
jgi:hypothetical protein